MLRSWMSSLVCLALLGCASLLASGCTNLKEYIHNGFKVGPNYCRPPAPVAPTWIDAQDKRVRQETGDLSKWWVVLNDPILNDLICCAYQQNLTLREAGFRVLQARAQLGLAIGSFFPQSQDMAGDYQHNSFSTEAPNRRFGTLKLNQFYSQWDLGFNIGWELDFWGRFRRAIEANCALLDASVEDYDDVLVTLLGDVAANYVQMRTTQKRLEYTRANVAIQRETVRIAEARYKIGTTGILDVRQAKSILAQTEAQVPELEIAARQSANLLCILLGIPPIDLQAKIGAGPIPTAPTEVAAGVPADLLRRRPDVRRAERQAAAQSAQIGIAVSEFYPHLSVNGAIGQSSQYFVHFFRPTALQAAIVPGFQWNILLYGRLANGVALQKARFQELVLAYQQAVLNASREVENGLITFLRAQDRTRFQTESVDEAQEAVKLVTDQYRVGTVDFTRVTQLEQNLVQQQDTLAQAQGEIALGLIQVYRALGGGWEIRCTGCETTSLRPHSDQKASEESLPAPRQESEKDSPNSRPPGPASSDS